MNFVNRYPSLPKIGEFNHKAYQHQLQKKAISCYDIRHCAFSTGDTPVNVSHHLTISETTNARQIKSLPLSTKMDSEGRNKWVALEEKLSRSKFCLGHDLGAGKPCMKCGQKCPGFALHYWRKVCRNCRCTKSDHNVTDSEHDLLVQGQNPMQPQPKRVITLYMPIDKNSTEVKKSVSMDWTPPNASQEVVEQYAQNIPIEKLPISGTEGAIYRQKQIEAQVPAHDFNPDRCDDLSANEIESLQEYAAKIKQKIVGQGVVKLIPGNRILVSRDGRQTNIHSIEPIKTDNITTALSECSEGRPMMLKGAGEPILISSGMDDVQQNLVNLSKLNDQERKKVEAVAETHNKYVESKIPYGIPAQFSSTEQPTNTVNTRQFAKPLTYSVQYGAQAEGNLDANAMRDEMCSCHSSGSKTSDHERLHNPSVGTQALESMYNESGHWIGTTNQTHNIAGREQALTQNNKQLWFPVEQQESNTVTTGGLCVGTQTSDYHMNKKIPKSTIGSQTSASLYALSPTNNCVQKQAGSHYPPVPEVFQQQVTDPTTKNNSVQRHGVPNRPPAPAAIQPQVPYPMTDPPSMQRHRVPNHPTVDATPDLLEAPPSVHKLYDRSCDPNMNSVDFTTPSTSCTSPYSSSTIKGFPVVKEEERKIKGNTKKEKNLPPKINIWQELLWEIRNHDKKQMKADQSWQQYANNAKYDNDKKAVMETQNEKEKQLQSDKALQGILGSDNDEMNDTMRKLNKMSMLEGDNKSGMFNIADMQNNGNYPNPHFGEGEMPVQCQQNIQLYKWLHDLDKAVKNDRNGNLHLPRSDAKSALSAPTFGTVESKKPVVVANFADVSCAVHPSELLKANALYPGEHGKVTHIKQAEGEPGNEDVVVEEAEVCRECSLILEKSSVGVYVDKPNINGVWHPQCFVCSHCKELLVDLIYFYYKGKIYCGRHVAEAMKIPRCYACDELIFVNTYTAAGDQSYHVKHFCCYECDNPLAGYQYVEIQSNPFCMDCYVVKFGKRCNTCEEMIAATDQRVSVKDRNWHADPKCFQCTKCKSSLLGKKFILVKNEPFCNKACATP